MALTHRERFILHTSCILTGGAGELSKATYKQIMDLIIRNRCRELKKDEYMEELLTDIEEEIALSKVLYDGSLL